MENIRSIWTLIQAIFAVVGGWLGWYLGGMDGMIIALVIFMVLDYITGVMCAIIDHKLSSEVGFKGIFKKLVILMMVGMGNILDVNVLGEGHTIRSAVVFFYLSNEGLSILENAGYIGLPIPESLKTILAQLHHRDEKSAKTEPPDENILDKNQNHQIPTE